jgi:DNA-directed RNA polymerase specialized sigma24 family protein
LTQHIGEFKRDPNRGSFKNWLMRLVQWKITDQLRKRQGAEQLDSSLAPEDALAFESLWEQDWQINAAEEAIRRIQNSARPRIFQAYSICVLQGRGARVASKLLKMSIPSVYVAIFRIRRQIQMERNRLRKGQF